VSPLNPVGIPVAIFGLVGCRQQPYTFMILHSLIYVSPTFEGLLPVFRLMDFGIPKYPIFVDSPLAVNVTSVFSLHPECYDTEINEFISQIEHADPFGFRDLTYVRSLEESKQLNFRLEPCIIISASGMMEFGRVLHHVKNRIEDEKTTILITGWQAENTLGRKLIDKEPVVRIFGENYRPRAHVEVLNGFSGHADRDELLTWVESIQRKPSRIFLVHGEEAESLGLKESLEQRFGIQTDVPSSEDEFVI
jgi:metallo-beta-lactamase family protein